MNHSDATSRLWLIAVLIAGLAGCQDRQAGTVSADPRTLEKRNRSPSDTSKSVRNGPDYRLRSPKDIGKEFK